MAVPFAFNGFSVFYHRRVRSDKIARMVFHPGRLPTLNKMTKKTWTLLTLAIALGALYVARFTDLGRQERIQINVAIRPVRLNAGPDDVLPVIFGLDREWPLTSVRVAPLSEATNAKPKCVWQLATKKASEPVRGFAYGEKIGGMDFVAGVAPGKLEAGVTYRLEVEAGRAKGQADFTAQSAAPAN
jgi:hypothetical protein